MRMHEALLYLPFIQPPVDPTYQIKCPQCQKPFAIAGGIVTTQGVREGQACLGWFCSEMCLLVFVPRAACGDA